MADTPVLTGGDGQCIEALRVAEFSTEARLHARLYRASEGLRRLIQGYDVFEDIDRLQSEYDRRRQLVDEAVWFKNRPVCVIAFLAISYISSTESYARENIMESHLKYRGVAKFEHTIENLYIAMLGIVFEMQPAEGSSTLIQFPIDQSTVILPISTN